MNQLNKRSQSLEFGLPRTLLHVSEAMDEARKLQDKSVGTPQGFTIVFRDGRMARLRPDAPFLKDWKKVYKGRDTGSLDYSDIAVANVKYQLMRHVSTRSISEKLKGRLW